MAWARVQSAGAVATGVATLSVTFTTQNVSSSNKYVVQAGCSIAGSPTISSVKDGTNSLTSSGLPQNTTSSAMDLFFLDIPAGSNGTKPTLIETPSLTADCSMTIQEISGLVTGNTVATAIDGTVRGNKTDTAAHASLAPSVAYSSSAVNEYLVVAYADNGPALTDTVTGYTIDANSTNASALNNSILAYKNSTNGTETATVTFTSTTFSDGIVVCAFNLASSGALTAALSASAAVAATNKEAAALTDALFASAAVAGTNKETVALTAALSAAAVVAGTNTEAVALSSALAASAVVASTNKETVALTAALSASAVVAGTATSSGAGAINAALTASAAVAGVNTETVALTASLSASAAVAGTLTVVGATQVTAALTASAALASINTEAVALSASFAVVAVVAGAIVALGVPGQGTVGEPTYATAKGRAQVAIFGKTGASSGGTSKAT